MWWKVESLTSYKHSQEEQTIEPNWYCADGKHWAYLNHKKIAMVHKVLLNVWDKQENLEICS